MLGLALAQTACAPPAAQPDTATADLGAANAQIVGSWRLVGYQPDVSLEPTLQGLLALEMQTMTIRFDGRRLLLDSPSIHMNRGYLITRAAGPRFDLVSPDDAGVAIVSSCQFLAPDRVVFEGKTSPWRGTGTLQKIGP